MDLPKSRLGHVQDRGAEDGRVLEDVLHLPRKTSMDEWVQLIYIYIYIHMEISMEIMEIIETLHWNLGEEGLPSGNFRFSNGTS